MGFSNQQSPSFLRGGSGQLACARSFRRWRTFAVFLLVGGSVAAPARADLSQVEHAKSVGAGARAVQHLAKKSGKTNPDPFSADDDGAAVQPSKGKSTDDAKSDKDTAAKSHGKSGDSLDNLMNDVVSDNKTGKPKKHDKEMDDLLKDVQKSDPAPVAKKKEEAPASPPLSPADISAAMAQVKVRGNACAQKHGRSGTAELKITVSREGKVTDVQLGGKLAGTPVASCIEQAVKTANFRPNAGLKFDYRMDVH